MTKLKLYSPVTRSSYVNTTVNNVIDYPTSHFLHTKERKLV